MDKQGKIKLIIYSALLLVLIAVLILGLVLFYNNDDDGTINVTGTNVDINVSAQVSGIENPPTLETITINGETSTSQVWHGIELEFANKDDIITIEITVENSLEETPISIDFNNMTTRDNLIIVQRYYLNENSANLTDLTGNVILNGSESCTFIVNFQIADKGMSVDDTLNINITCNAIE